MKTQESGNTKFNPAKMVVLSGGCFWCTEAIFKMLKGVISVTPGYAGGPPTSSGQAPTYEEVCSGKTGHAEVIKIEYDEEKISFRNLLTVFFATHDPTTPNQQGNDIGPQYRSIILYSNERQKEEAEEFIKDLNTWVRPMDAGVEPMSEKPIITELGPLDKFYEAENYHKSYYERNKNAPYCQIVINPKLKKVQEKFAELLKKYE